MQSIRRVIGVLLAISLILAACNSNSTTPEEPAQSDTTAAADAAPATLEPITAIFASTWSMNSLGLAASLPEIWGANSLWDIAGLGVEIVEGQSTVEALASGDADIAQSNPAQFIAAMLRGGDMKIIGPVFHKATQMVNVRADLGVTSLDELSGGTFGVTGFGSSGHHSTVKIAQLLGWSEDDYEIITLGSLDGIRAAITEGQIDAFAWSSEGSYALADAGETVILGRVGDFVGWHPSNVMVASGEAIRNKPESVRAYCEGFYEAVARLQTQPQLAEQLLIEQGGWEPDVVPRTVETELSLLAATDHIPDVGFEALAEAAVLQVDGVEEMSPDEVRDMYVPCGSLGEG